MYCEKCGSEMPNDARFCGNCGAVVENAESGKNGEHSLSDNTNDPVLSNMNAGQAPDKLKTTVPSYQQEISYMEPSAYSKVFIEPDEQLLGRLGNGYLENILYKRVKKCHALLTDKRVYFQGAFFTGRGKQLSQVTSERIVDLEDITGTGFIYSQPMGVLTAIIALLIPWVIAFMMDPFDMSSEFAMMADIIVAIGIFIVSLVNRKTYFVIEYAGGEIQFDAQILGLSKVRDFQKQIRRAKDKIKRN